MKNVMVQDLTKDLLFERSQAQLGVVENYINATLRLSLRVYGERSRTVTSPLVLISSGLGRRIILETPERLLKNNFTLYILHYTLEQSG